MASAPRIVIVAPEAPQPLTDNAGAGYLTDLVVFLTGRGAHVTIIVPETPTTTSAAQVAEGWRVVLVPVHPTQLGGLRRRVADFIGRLAHTRPPRGFVKQLRGMPEALTALGEADIVDAQWPTMVAILPELHRLAPEARLIATLHDVASQGNRRQMQRARSFKRWVRFAANVLHTRYIERRVTALAGTVIVFSVKDRELLTDKRNVEVVYPPLAAGLDGATAVVRDRDAAATVLMVGPLYRAENRGGLDWFAGEVWPRVRARHPTVRLVVAGRVPQGLQEMFAQVPGLEFAGFVEDLEPLYSASSAAIAPLQLGAGVKFKVVDAMVRGVPVVGTTVAFEGIGDADQVPTATDTPQEFADALNRVLDDPARARADARIWRAWALRRYSAKAFAHHAAAVYGLPMGDGEPRADPLASVVIPVRNGEHRLSVQLSALATQAEALSLEVIIADNGSTDRTSEVAHAFRQDFAELRVVNASGRRGAGHARNIGLIHARSAKVLFCDHDDEVQPGWAQKLISALDRFDLVGGRLAPTAVGTEPVTRIYRTDGLAGVLGYLPYAVSANLAVRRVAALTVGGFDESFSGGHEEADFCWRVQRAGYSIGYESDAVVAYRQRDSLAGRISQSYRAARSRIQLWQRYHLTAALQPISLRGALAGAISSPRYVFGLVFPRARDNSARALGWVWGTLAGHIQFRIRARTPAPRLIAAADGEGVT